VEASVVEAPVLDDPARAAHRERRRTRGHRVRLGAQQHHADHGVARERGFVICR
jgi:hypothetical protein